MNNAEVTHFGMLDMQVCVPVAWPNQQVLAFAAQKHPCGTTNGWTIRREGDEALGGDPERNACTERNGYVHIVLDA